MLFKSHMLNFSIPRFIKSDNASYFRSPKIQQLANAFKTEWSFIVAYTPELNGKLERMHGPLKQGIRCLIDQNKVDWCDALPLATFCINNQRTGSSELSAYEKYFMRTNNCPAFRVSDNELFESQLDPNLLDYLTSGRYIADVIDKKHRQQNNLNVGTSDMMLAVGDQVFVRHIINPGIPSAMQEKYSGPFKVVKVRNNFVFDYERDDGKILKCHIRNAKKRGPHNI